ncbi:hypothetical protein [Rhodopirellula halodulae]|uniref:hypothetical protein n=1 Tax=Rhodopirellula halodulae TaxID=2894198 RepID=UPI001E2F94A8|nr:hypothetical protein [Rhodopirellula sp. JC737]MCC9655281.1 hypothetical protein [Rhodopirellula sp. JC737]
MYSEKSEGLAIPSDVDLQAMKRNYYFTNEVVEWLLTQYNWTGCTSVELRDEIMQWSESLIRQIIRKQGLHKIYAGHDDASFGDLVQTAWIQIERTLYKFRATPHCRTCFRPKQPSRSVLYTVGEFEYGIKTLEEVQRLSRYRCPHCGASLLGEAIIEPSQGRYGGTERILWRGTSKVFNLWTQVSRTCILAYIKKDNRDGMQHDGYKSAMERRDINRDSGAMDRFFSEARDLCRFNREHLLLIDSLEELFLTDEAPSQSLVRKLVEKSDLSRASVGRFFQAIRFQSFQFSDSPLNRGASSGNVPDRKSDQE